MNRFLKSVYNKILPMGLEYENSGDWDKVKIILKAYEDTNSLDLFEKELASYGIFLSSDLLKFTWDILCKAQERWA